MRARRGSVYAGMMPASALALALASALVGAPAVAGPERRTGKLLDGARLRARAKDPARLAARRRRLLAAMGPNRLLVLAAAERPAEDYLPETPDPNFFYLAGFGTGSAVIVLATDGAGEPTRHDLFLEHRNPQRELWEGPRASVEGFAAQARHWRAIRGLEELAAELTALAKGREVAVCGLEQAGLAELGLALDEEPDRAEPLVNRLRVVKDEVELALIQRAVDITVAAHLESMRSLRPGQFEYEHQATLEYVFKRHGAERPAFNSICGSGPNSCVLHYSASRRLMRPGELIVVDIGAAFGGYAADLTRTLPVSGRFTKRQRELYDIVLEAWRAGVKAVKPGATLREVHKAARAVFERKGVAKFFPHGTSHWLGIEVHDVPWINGATKFEPGMVLTVEPGLYVEQEAIGIRIEDDVVVTERGCRVLSDELPRTAPELEAIMKRGGGIGRRPIEGLPLRRLPKLY